MSMEPFGNPEWLSLVMSMTYMMYFAIITPFAIAAYIVQGLSLMRIAKKLDVEKGWMAFIPFANLYLIGKLAEKSDERAYPEGTGKKWSKILVGWSIATVAAVLVLTVLMVAVLVGTAVSTKSDEAVIAATVISCVVYTFLLLIPAIVLSVYEYMAYYRIYRVMAGQRNAVWMLLLTIFVNPAATVILAVLGFSPKFPVAEEEPVNHFEYRV